jgi:hypothetical protein
MKQGLLFNSFNKESAPRVKLPSGLVTTIGEGVSSITGSRLRSMKRMAYPITNRPSAKNFMEEAKRRVSAEAPAIPLNPVSKWRYNREVREVAKELAQDYKMEKDLVGRSRKDLSKIVAGLGLAGLAASGKLPGTKSMLKAEEKFLSDLENTDLSESEPVNPNYRQMVPRERPHPYPNPPVERPSGDVPVAPQGVQAENSPEYSKADQFSMRDQAWPHTSERRIVFSE